MAIVVIELDEGEIKSVHCESPSGCTVFVVDRDWKNGTVSKIATQHKSTEFIKEVMNQYLEQKRQDNKKETDNE